MTTLAAQEVAVPSVPRPSASAAVNRASYADLPHSVILRIFDFEQPKVRSFDPAVLLCRFRNEPGRKFVLQYRFIYFTSTFSLLLAILARNPVTRFIQSQVKDLLMKFDDVYIDLAHEVFRVVMRDIWRFMPELEMFWTVYRGPSKEKMIAGMRAGAQAAAAYTRVPEPWHFGEGYCWPHSKSE
jgi:hypothetical protein